MQNWNDGKSQEYKNRTVYDIAHSDFKGSTKTVAMTAEDVRIEETRNGQVTAKYLFTTETCPNCKIAKQMLEGEDYELVDAEKNPELARKFGVMQAPTLIVINGEETKKYVNASNIQRYVDED